MEDVNTGYKFNLFSESELGCGPQDSLGKFTYICHFKRVDGNKCEKVKKQKKAGLILIGRDVYVALAVVVAKTPYIHESDSSIWFYCKLVLSNAEKYPDKLDKLFTLQNVKTFTRHRIHFRFRFQNL